MTTREYKYLRRQKFARILTRNLREEVTRTIDEIIIKRLLEMAAESDIIPFRTK